MYWEDLGKPVLWTIIHLSLLWFIVVLYTNAVVQVGPEQKIWLQAGLTIGIFLYITFVVLMDRIHRLIKDITESMESINESLENMQEPVEIDEENGSEN